MAINFGYYIPLSANLFESVRFLGIAPKTDLLEGGERTPRKDKSGTPMWVVSALVKFDGSTQETENFTLTISKEEQLKIAQIGELAPIRLVGLSGGKWSRATSDQTAWTFQIKGVEPIKNG